METISSEKREILGDWRRNIEKMFLSQLSVVDSILVAWKRICYWQHDII